MKDYVSSADVQHYAPSARECELFEMAQDNGLPLFFEGADGMRQNSFCRTHGRKVRQAIVHGGLPR